MLAVSLLATQGTPIHDRVLDGISQAQRADMDFANYTRVHLKVTKDFQSKLLLLLSTNLSVQATKWSFVEIQPLSTHAASTPSSPLIRQKQGRAEHRKQSRTAMVDDT